MQIHAAWHAASAALKQATQSDEAKLEAQLLLEHVLNVNHAWLIAHAEDELDHQSQTQFQLHIERRTKGEPIAYILGEREFFGLTLKVTPDTLIPRSDTEIMVEIALEKIASLRHNRHERHTDNAKSSFRQNSESSDFKTVCNKTLDSDFRRNDGQVKVLDLGTGTGAIALAIAKHAPDTQVTAVDFSKGALLVAQQNAQNLNIHNVAFINSDWFNALQGQRHDVIVSNPPYIEGHDIHLNQGDLRFEPLSALASGDDGLHDIRHIISHAKQYLNSNGWLLIEHGYNQSGKVAGLMQQAQFNAIQHINDLAGIARVTIAQN